MRTYRWIESTIMSMIVVAAGISASPAATAHSGDAHVKVEGVVARLADTVDGFDAALRLPNGSYLPVDDAGSARPGDTVAVTMDVPDVVVRAAVKGEAMAGVDGQVRLNRSELRLASGRPAESTSALSKATQRQVVSDGTVAPVRSVHVLAHSQPPSSAPATHEVTVAIVAPRGVSAKVATAAQVAQQVKGADAYWREQSGGTVSLRLARTVGPYASRLSCQDNPFDMWTEAARATGFVEGANKHLVMVFPKEATGAGCSYGLASMGQGLSTGGIAYVSDTAWPVLAHELGHNLGLAHAKGLRCKSATDVNLSRVPAGCSIDEYGDPFDIMAASAADSAGSLSVPQAVRLGLIGSNGYVSVTGGSRVLALSPVSSLKGVRGVRVRDPRSGATYWVEMRTRTGRDAKLYQPMMAGVRVLREEAATQETPWAATVALDASPTGKSWDSATTMTAGSTFTTYGAGVVISVASVGSTAAKVTVSTAAAGRTIGARAGIVARSAGTKAVAVAPATPKVSISNKGVVSWGTTKGAKYDVVMRRASGKSYGKTQTWYAATSRTSAKLTARKGTTIQVRARTRVGSKVGAWSGWRAVAFR